MIARLRRALRPLAREQGGWTLIEMLVASAAGLTVIGAATLVFTSAIHSQPRTTSRGADIERARVTMERVTRELRQGWSVPTATSSQLQILTYVKSATCGGVGSSASRVCLVTYTCGSTSCQRVEASPDGTAPGAPKSVVAGITGPDVFSYQYPPGSSDPSYVGLTLSVPAGAGEDTITVSDGAALRNPGSPS